MAKFETLKTLEAIKVNKKTGIQQSQRINLSFGSIIEDPFEERDCLRFLHLGEMYDVKLSEISGYYKVIGGPASDPAPVPKAEPAAKKPEAPAGPSLKFETLKSNMTASRAKIPGGWLVAIGHGVTFVPDESHYWDGNSI